MLKNVYIQTFNFVIILYLSGDNCSAEARKQEQNTVGLVLKKSLFILIRLQMTTTIHLQSK